MASRNSRPAVVILAVIATSTAGSQARPAQQTTPQTQPTAYRALIDQYCIGCHNETRKVGGLVLDTADLSRVADHGEIWEKVIRKLRSNAMPPEGVPRPAPAVRDGFIAALEQTLDAAYLKTPKPGRTETFHRLNRTEYRNAIRDLLDLDIDVSELLPADDVSFGFDNIAGVLGISPVLLERYTTAAQKVSRLAIGSSSGPATAITFRVASDLPQNDHVDGLPLGTRGGLSIDFVFPLDAHYGFDVKLARDYTDSLGPINEPHQLEVTVDGARVAVYSLTPTPGRGGRGRPDADADFNVRVPVKAGPRRVVVAFVKKTSAVTEGQRLPPIRPAIGAGGDTRHEPYVGSVTISGPFDPTGPGDTPSRRRVFVCGVGRVLSDPAQDQCARRILSGLARRAYRRPPTDSDLQALLSFYNEGKADGGFEAGIELALRRLLVSPSFLMRIERDPAGVAPNSTYAISDIELASRLSFFLWSTIPDDELLDLAAKGRLRDRAVLEAQVRRMLDNPRSSQFVTNFPGQWLYLRNLQAVRPDEELFPDFDDGLRQAFRRETEMFFDSLVRENRSVLDLLNADYTYVNERLARHYGIPGVYGSQFRRVTLQGPQGPQGPQGLQGGPRAGILGHGSVLAVTSFPNRTSPVLRGKWVLDNLLGFPPPEPPADVPALKENVDGVKALSVRQRLEAHRANPGCASCHKIMDPLGFALENFDAVGRWRDLAEDGSRIDPSGALIDGTRLDGPESLRRALLSNPESFVRTLTEKLLIYALGRGTGYYDQPAIRQIVRSAGGSRATLSGLIMAIVKSPPFQSRRSA